MRSFVLFFDDTLVVYWLCGWCDCVRIVFAFLFVFVFVFVFASAFVFVVVS